MPIVYQCVPDEQLVIDVFHGELVFAELREHVARQVADPAWHATTKALVDLSTAHLPGFTDDGFDQIAALMAQRSDQARGRTLAIVGGGAWETATATGRASAAKLGVDAIVFNEVATACTWLGVDPNTARTTIAHLRRRLRANT